MEQRTFETAVSSSASIVKPTVPKNVLAEFQHFAATGNRYQKQNPFDDDDSNHRGNGANPFGQGSAPPPVMSTRGAAPAPPMQQPIAAPVRTQPPPEQRFQPVTHVEFKDFGDFNISQAPPAVHTPQPQDDKSRLISSMQQFLRLKAAHAQAVSVGELSGQIREITGQSWGGFWEHKYGNLLNFLKGNPDAFTVLKSKYVTCKGQEDVAMRYMEREQQELQERQQQSYLSAAPSYIQASQGLHSQMQQSFYAPNFDDPFQTSFYSPPPQQHDFYSQPAQQHDLYSRPPLPPNVSQQHSQSYDWSFAEPPSRSNSTISRRDSSGSDWQLPNQGGPGMFAPLDPFGSSGGGQYDDWWGASASVQGGPPSNGNPFNFGSFEESLLTQPSAIAHVNDEDDEEVQKAEKRAARKAKKQEEQDEALARELQAKEFERDRATESNDSGETIVLTTPQMRDLAEKEIGTDNVRIIAGFTVKKYGREGRPHQRKMWVTQSLTHLAWASSLLEGSHRGIELRTVTEVTSGHMTPTIARSTGDKNKVRAQCFSLISPSRTLDMQACSIIQRDVLVSALKAVVAFNRKYKPEKVDRDLTRIRLVDNAYMFKKG